MDPVQGLPGILGEALDPLSGELDQASHELALARTADHPGGTRRGLRTDVVPVDERDVLNSAFDEMESSRRTQPTGPDNDHVGFASHRTSLLQSAELLPLHSFRACLVMTPNVANKPRRKAPSASCAC